MDVESLSYIFGGLAALGAYAQTKFPDARNVRNISIGTRALMALSYAAQNASIAAGFYGAAAIRALARTTPWGTRNRKLVTGLTVATVGSMSLALSDYKSVADALPFVSICLGSAGDYTNQGRYYRLAVATALTTCVFPLAVLKENWTAGAAEGIAGAYFLKSIYNNDIKNAAGPHQPLYKNLLAYGHGILYDSATGAKIEGQVSSDMAPEDTKKLYALKLKSRPNPFYNPKDGGNQGPANDFDHAAPA